MYDGAESSPLKERPEYVIEATLHAARLHLILHSSSVSGWSIHHGGCCHRDTNVSMLRRTLPPRALLTTSVTHHQVKSHSEVLNGVPKYKHTGSRNAKIVKRELLRAFMGVYLLNGLMNQVGHLTL